MLKNRFFLYIFLLLLTLTSCAKRGGITGGALDTIPPVLTSSSPKNYSTGFNGNLIKINFDEYIKIKDISKQLIISPPLTNAPEIVPMGNASKFITIKIKDTLLPNTTYSFNFGQSITDNNEGNPYTQFKFVFSTGAYIDSLSLKGKIKDSYSKNPDNFVTVMLYEANETFNDSTIYKEKPRYVTNTLDSLTMYSLDNLKEGKYHIIALKDKNNNYRFDPKTDKIAFLKKPITIPTDTLYQLELFNEKLPFKAVRPTQVSANKLLAGYEGDAKGVKINVRNGQEAIKSITTKFPDKDSLNIWIPTNIKADSLQVSYTHRDSIKNFSIRIKEMKEIDSLSVNAVQKGVIDFRDTFTLTASTPLITLDESKISLINKDSAAVAFKTAYDDFKKELTLDFVKEEDQKYSFTLLPGALKDFYDTENDTLKYNLTTKTYADYGNLRVRLENANRFPLILELTNAKGEVKASYYSESETEINFDAILPDKYTLRVIYDDNKNKEWDTGNYIQKLQPEEVIYFPGEVDVRANWDVDQPFNLSN